MLHRLDKLWLTMLIGLTWCLPLVAQAAGNGAPNARHASGVIMMIGGMANADDTVSPSSPATVATSAALHEALPDDDRVSVVIRPGATQSTAAAAPSAAVSSRVRALAPLVDEAARAANIDSALLMAVIDVESGGNPQAVSPKGATGLMQLMPDTGARQGASNLFDPRQNIAAGARYLHQLMQQFGDLQMALAAYNAGEGAVQKYGGQIPPYAETMDYLPRVMARYLHYRNAVSSAGPAFPDAGGDENTAQGRFLLVRQSGGTRD